MLSERHWHICRLRTRSQQRGRGWMGGRKNQIISRRVQNLELIYKIRKHFAMGKKGRALSLVARKGGN